jgi:hypothetical protein
MDLIEMRKFFIEHDSVNIIFRRTIRKISEDGRKKFLRFAKYDMELTLALKGKHSKILITAPKATIPNQFLKAQSGTIYK